jgi:hypothetical protein
MVQSASKYARLRIRAGGGSHQNRLESKCYGQEKRALKHDATRLGHSFFASSIQSRFLCPGKYEPNKNAKAKANANSYAIPGRCAANENLAESLMHSKFRILTAECTSGNIKGASKRLRTY